MFVSSGFCQKDESLGVVCQAFLVSSLFSGTVLVIVGRMDPWMPKHGEGKTLSLWNVEDLFVFWPSFVLKKFQAGPFWGKCIGTSRDVFLSVLNPYDCNSADALASSPVGQNLLKLNERTIPSLGWESVQCPCPEFTNLQSCNSHCMHSSLLICGLIARDD